MVGLLGIAAVLGKPAGLDELHLLEEGDRIPSFGTELLFDLVGGPPFQGHLFQDIPFHGCINGPQHRNQLRRFVDDLDSCHEPYA